MYYNNSAHSKNKQTRKLSHFKTFIVHLTYTFNSINVMKSKSILVCLIIKLQTVKNQI